MSTFSDFSTNPAAHTPEASASPPPAQHASNQPGATNGVAGEPHAEPQELPERPREKARRDEIQEYMRQYASGEMGRRAGSTGHDGRDANGQDTLMMEGIEGAAANQVSNPAHAQAQASAEDQGYASFLASAQHRAMRRHDLATRDRIFSEALARARARLQQLGEEKAALEAKVAQIERAREGYAVRHAVGVSEVEDQREARRWEEWFRVQRGVDVREGGAVVAEGGERGRDEEVEEGGVDI